MAADVNPNAVAVPATIIPAMAALWWLLKRYEGHFVDARVFFSLVVGFFVGLLATFLELNLFLFPDADAMARVGVGASGSFILTVVGYAFFESGAKTMVLGLRRFRQRKDTPYYGMALGLGFGAMAALQFVALNLHVAQQRGAPYTVATGAAMVAVAVGALFAQGGAATFIGRGSARGELGKGWLVGGLLLMPSLGTYWMFWPYLGWGAGRYLTGILFPAVLSLGYGLGLLVIAQRRVLDPIVPPEIKEQVRRERRRRARQQRRERETGRSTAPAAGATAGAAGAAGAAAAGAAAGTTASRPTVASAAPPDGAGSSDDEELDVVAPDELHVVSQDGEEE